MRSKSSLATATPRSGKPACIAARAWQRTTISRARLRISRVVVLTPKVCDSKGIRSRNCSTAVSKFLKASFFASNLLSGLSAIAEKVISLFIISAAGRLLIASSSGTCATRCGQYGSTGRHSCSRISAARYDVLADRFVRIRRASGLTPAFSSRRISRLSALTC